ncbi:Tetratricopeptide repeat protein 4-like protein [Morus notabilis]|uniref:Tetratricopeptide repeat protein 4-like protein n=1 Tax=Morus notabilis TaxID=981085 RepID=W9RBA2_9ROSA|nr:Tetratricopeptide repeat protein 4-like protein [Morus notabilis]
MALWMEKGSEPLTDAEKADLDAIAALKESAAFELKEKGNQYVKMGKKHYSDAIDCYTRAIDQKVLSDSETSLLFSNRAHVNLLLGNYRRALTDSEEALNLSPTNIKAFYRAAKASLSLNLLSEAKSHCENGIKQDPDNQELKKLLSQIDSLKLEQEQRQAQVSMAISEAKNLLSAMESRGYKIGKAMFRELVGLRKPVLDKKSSPPLPWDTENNYNCKDVEIYYEPASGACLPKKKILHYFLEGTAASNVEDIGNEEKDAVRNSNHLRPSGSAKWVKVNEKRTLHDVLKEPNFIIQGIPVFYVVSKKSDFYKKFKAGLWAPPS